MDICFTGLQKVQVDCLQFSLD